MLMEIDERYLGMSDRAAAYLRTIVQTDFRLKYFSI